MKTVFLILAGFLLIFFSQPESKKRFDLSEKQQNAGWYLEHEGNDIAKVMHPVYGYLKTVSLTAPEVKLSKTSQSIQTIDLRNVDTNLYSDLFAKKDFFPAAGIIGYPVQIGDFNNNEQMDFYGAYNPIWDTQLAEACVVELNSDSSFILRKIYHDSLVEPLPFTDINKDGFLEMNFRRGQSLAHLKSNTPDSFPDSISFLYELWQWSGQVSGETVYDLDKDGNMDLLYMGDDTLDPRGHKIFIAEYNDSLNNYEKKYRFQPPDWETNGFAVVDLDNDGFMEFGVGSIHGDVYIFENTGDDSYQLVLEDTISTSNAYLSVATNDIDSNGKSEYIVGGSSYFNGVGGTRFYWYEADGNNSYAKVRSFFLLGVDPLSWDEIHTFDANNDGKDDILINYTYAIVILTWNNKAEEFEVFYYSAWDYPVHGVTMYDLNKNGKLDFFISVKEIENVPARRTYYYENKVVTSIKNIDDSLPSTYQLNQNYPNPFNNNTKIKFSVKKSENISLIIFNTLGKEVKTLINRKAYNPGEHTIDWDSRDNNGKEVASGLYICVLSNGEQTFSGKMLLIK